MISLKDFWTEIKNELQKNHSAMLCLVAEKQGSAPRGPGAHMLVKQDGSTLDTIGGGALEYETKMQALAQLTQKTSSLRRFALNNNDASAEGMICGGQLSVLLLYLSDKDLPQIEKALTLTDHRLILSADWHQDRYTFAIYSLDEDFPLKQELLDKHKNTMLTLDKETNSGSYREICRRLPTLYLFGGGWVAQELAKLLPALEFDYVLIEERPEFASHRLFPKAKNIIITDYDDFTADLQIKPSDFAVVVTSGHRKDTAVLSQLLNIAPAYIGAIGSRRKKAIIGKYLKEHNFSDEQINSIHLPIGLNINAQTPAEIAISIAAQLIECRASL